MLPLKKYVHYFAVQIHTARAEFCRGSHGHLGQLLGKLNLAVIILEVKKIELYHRILQVKNISLSPETSYIGGGASPREPDRKSAGWGRSVDFRVHLGGIRIF